MITYLGSRTVGDFIPAAVNMQVQLLADLQARLAAQESLVLQLNTTPLKFTIAGSLQVALDLVAQIELMISLGVEMPTIQVQLDLALALIAQLEISIGLLLELQVAFGTAGVHGYTYSGPTNQLGGEFTSALAGGFPGGTPTDHANAIVLATTVPTAWAALGKILVTG